MWEPQSSDHPRIVLRVRFVDLLATGSAIRCEMLLKRGDLSTTSTGKSLAAGLPEKPSQLLVAAMTSTAEDPKAPARYNVLGTASNSCFKLIARVSKI